MTKRSFVIRAAMCFSALSVCMTTTAVAQNQCGPLTDVIRVGFNETEISSTVNEARDLYNWACGEESRETATGTSTSINASWGGFGGGAKRGSSSLDEHRQQNCHLSQDTVTSYVANSFRQRTIDPAVLQAWQSCQASQGIALTPNVLLDQTQVNFTLEGTQLPLATLRGIRSRHFMCSAGAGGEITESGINGESVSVPGDVALNIYCQRRPVEQEIGGRAVTVYLADVLSLDLSTGAHDMEFAERRVGPVAEEFADLQERFRSMRAELDMLREEVRVQSGIVRLAYSSGERPLAQQRGESRLRGIVAGRVDFPVAFARVPEVQIALAGVDMSSGANARLRVRVTSVDREGFEYELYSWADTHVFTASASWVAVVP